MSTDDTPKAAPPFVHHYKLADFVDGQAKLTVRVKTDSWEATIDGSIDECAFARLGWIAARDRAYRCAWECYRQITREPNHPVLGQRSCE